MMSALARLCAPMSSIVTLPTYDLSEETEVGRLVDRKRKHQGVGQEMVLKSR